MLYEDFPKRLPRSSLQHDVPICIAGCATPGILIQSRSK
jgi:hypothetical protein